MSIPESQFETWSHQGATKSASEIYERIRRALMNDAVLSGRNFEVFLQGSYRNSTNIYGDSDVDVVVMLKDTYSSDYSRLDPYTRNRIQANEVSATYTFEDFRKDVSNAIRRAFPNHTILEGGKSIKIPRTLNNIPADVVPCISYRMHTSESRVGYPAYIEGIWLRDIKRNYSVVSFPKQHYDNGVTKHGRSNQWYKPTIRIFKNAENCAEQRGLIQEGIASSYAIECLLYNVPLLQFGGTYQDTFVNTLNWLSNADMATFMCQNGIHRLFEEDRWTTQKARIYIGALITMWNQWGQNARVRL